MIKYSFKDNLLFPYGGYDTHTGLPTSPFSVIMSVTPCIMLVALHILLVTQRIMSATHDPLGQCQVQVSVKKMLILEQQYFMFFPYFGHLRGWGGVAQIWKILDFYW